MFKTTYPKFLLACAGALILVVAGIPPAQSGPNAMNNPYRMLENWGTLPEGVKWGSTIGIIPDGKGGVWIHHRSDPPIIKLDSSGKVTKTFGKGMFVQAHGFCMDQDGNLWAGDSGPFRDDPSTAGRGYQFFKFTPDGKVLLTLGKAGVSKAGRDTFIAQPPALSPPTATSSSPTGIFRALRPASRTATGSCGSQRTGSTSTRGAGTGRGRVSSTGPTRWPSIRKAGCSWPTAPTTESRSSTSKCSSWTTGDTSDAPAA